MFPRIAFICSPFIGPARNGASVSIIFCRATVSLSSRTGIVSSGTSDSGGTFVTASSSRSLRAGGFWSRKMTTNSFPFRLPEAWKSVRASPSGARPHPDYRSWLRLRRRDCELLFLYRRLDHYLLCPPHLHVASKYAIACSRNPGHGPGSWGRGAVITGPIRYWGLGKIQDQGNDGHDRTEQSKEREH